VRERRKNEEKPVRRGGIESTDLVSLRSRVGVRVSDVEGHDLPSRVTKSSEVGSDEARVSSDDRGSLREQRLEEKGSIQFANQTRPPAALSNEP